MNFSAESIRAGVDSMATDQPTSAVQIRSAYEPKSIFTKSSPCFTIELPQYRAARHSMLGSMFLVLVKLFVEYLSFPENVLRLSYTCFQNVFRRPHGSISQNNWSVGSTRIFLERPQAQSIATFSSTPDPKSLLGMIWQLSRAEQIPCSSGENIMGTAM